jgi:hypothetical protein
VVVATAASAAPPSLDYFKRTTWTSLTADQTTEHWVGYQHSAQGAATGMPLCPKLAPAHFWYPSLNATLRGMRVEQPIAKGEQVCTVGVRKHMVSDLTVGNTSLRALGLALKAQAAKKTIGERTTSPMAFDRRTMLALLLLREGERERSTLMPFIKLLDPWHDVSGVSLMWGEDSPRLAAASPDLQSLAKKSRAGARAQYRALFSADRLNAVARFGTELSEGIDCTRFGDGAAGKTCSAAALRRVYAEPRFLQARHLPLISTASSHVVSPHHLPCSSPVNAEPRSSLQYFALVAARDWFLPVYGVGRNFLAMEMDMLNFGQSGIRVGFNNQLHAFTATATQPIAGGAEALFFYGSFCAEKWQSMCATQARD